MNSQQLCSPVRMGTLKSYKQVFNIFKWPIVLAPLLFPACKAPERPTLQAVYETLPHVQGHQTFAHTKTFTSGTKAYCVGAQDGTFPDLGWHIKGEMGGLWAHPIKLLDGYSAALIRHTDTIPLNNAQHYRINPVGNQWIYILGTDTVVRSQFIPDAQRGMVVEFALSGEPAELLFTPQPDLRPTWLGERTHMKNGTDQSAALIDRWTATDSESGWSVHIRTTRAAGAQITTKHIQTTKGLVHTFYIGGGLTADEARNTCDQLTAFELDGLLSNKVDRHRTLAKRSQLTSNISPEIDQTFQWLKHNAIWLEMDADSLGYGFAAGMEDYPWFFGCDSEFSILGLNAVGRYDLSKSMLRLLVKASERENGNGKIIHEMSTNGAVFNPGNLNETPQFVSACYDTYLWSGDLDFLQEMYPFMLKSMRWLAEQDPDGNGIPDGYGMMEIHGMNGEMIDVASYTVQGWAALSQAASLIDSTSDVSSWAQHNSEQLAQFINTHYWVETAGAYADVRGTKEQVMELIDGAIERAADLDKPWAVTELEQTKAQAQRSEDGANPYSVHHNWIVNTPMEVGFAPVHQALKALDKAAQYTNPFGCFVTGIDRDQTAGSDLESFAARKQTFTYVGAVMTLPTGVAAVAENNYGRPDHALDYLERMTRSWSYAHPGSMYEVSPDFGMMCQAWNVYSFAFPIVRQFFGIQPFPQNEQIVIAPNFPSDWTQPQLKDVFIGEGEQETQLSITFARGQDGNKSALHIQQKGPHTYEILLPVPDHSRLYVNGSLTKGQVAEHPLGAEPLINGRKGQWTRIQSNDVVIEW